VTPSCIGRDETAGSHPESELETRTRMQVGAIETAEEFGKAHLPGGLEARLEPVRKEGHDG
jgi:hypothetical protein